MQKVQDIMLAEVQGVKGAGGAPSAASPVCVERYVDHRVGTHHAKAPSTAFGPLSPGAQYASAASCSAGQYSDATVVRGAAVGPTSGHPSQVKGSL